MSRFADPSVPRNYMEKYFLYKLRFTNLPKPVIRRSDWGMMVAAWRSPNPAVGEFTAYIDYRAEVILSCLIAHKHCRGVDCRFFDKTTKKKLKTATIREAIAKIEIFLTDQEIVFSTMDESGRVYSSGWTTKLPSKMMIEAYDAQLARDPKGKRIDVRHLWSGPYNPKALIDDLSK